MRPGRTARVGRVTHIAVAVDRQLAAKIVVAAGVIPSSATTGGVAQIALVAVDEAIVLVSRHQHREVVDPGVEAVAVRRAAVHVHLVFAGVVVAVNAVRAIKTAPLGLVGTAVRGVRRRAGTKRSRHKHHRCGQQAGEDCEAGGTPQAEPPFLLQSSPSLVRLHQVGWSPRADGGRRSTRATTKLQTAFEKLQWAWSTKNRRVSSAPGGTREPDQMAALPRGPA